jgi:hypothetical protein
VALWEKRAVVNQLAQRTHARKKLRNAVNLNLVKPKSVATKTVKKNLALTDLVRKNPNVTNRGELNLPYFFMRRILEVTIFVFTYFHF